MNLPVTIKNETFPTNSPVFELWTHCPYLTCGEQTNAGLQTHICGQCGNAFNVCDHCRATNRLLSIHCRGCGQKLATQTWPMETGLYWSSIPRPTIKSIEAVHVPFPINLRVGVQVSPVACDGLIVICNTNGGVIVISEYTGERLLEFSVGSQIAVTPALRNGMLFVATANEFHAFDLAAYLDQPSRGHITPAWSFSCGAETISQPLLADDTAVYVLTQNSLQTVLYAVSQEDGIEIWPSPLVLHPEQAGCPLLVQDQVVLVSPPSSVTVVAAATGDVTQTFSLNRLVDQQVTPFVTGNRVFLSDPTGHIFEIVFDRSGPLINPLHDAGSRISTIAASNEYLVLSHLAGVTLLSSRGALLWTGEIMESVSTVPIISGESFFVLDDGGNGLLFEMLKTNPIQRMRLLPGEIGLSPLRTQSHIVVVGAEGKVVALKWQS
jgi:putative pyrroloquinoline-quinone binding quinoprotein